jgi:hypothetical protein
VLPAVESLTTLVVLAPLGVPGGGRRAGAELVTARATGTPPWVSVTSRSRARVKPNSIFYLARAHVFQDRPTGSPRLYFLSYARAGFPVKFQFTIQYEFEFDD